MNTHESYVSLETAKLLKQAGFDWEVNTLYQCYPEEEVKFVLDNFVFNYNIHSNVISAPTIEVAQRWLREVKDWILETHYFGEEFFVNDEVDIESDLLRKYPNKLFYMCYGYFENCMYIEEDGNTYEEAQESGIKEALEIILKKGEYENN